MMEPYSLGSVASAGATMLADSVVVGSVVAVLAGGLNLLFRRRGASLRFGVLMAAILATASLPAIRFWFADTVRMNGSVSLLHFAGAWAPWILGLWATIATIALARVVFGLGSLQRLRRRCSGSDGTALVVDFADLVRTHCPSRKVELLVSPQVTVPAAIGFLRPAVILPEWIVEEMSADEVRQILIHELSHLRRYDDWTNLVQKIVQAFLFFHPAIWWMERRMSMEREMACDDAVLMRTANARSYAECLARMAEKTFLRRGLAMAQAAVSRVRQTSLRVARILGTDRVHVVRMGKTSAVLATVLTVFGMGVAFRTPVLLSFGGSNQEPAMAKVTAADVPAPLLRPVQAAWHEDRNAAVKPASQRAVHTATVPKPMPRRDPVRVVQASTRAQQPLTRSVLILVVQDSNGVAVWRITTWHYSPSEEGRSARKTT